MLSGGRLHHKLIYKVISTVEKSLLSHQRSVGAAHASLLLYISVELLLPLNRVIFFMYLCRKCVFEMD